MAVIRAAVFLDKDGTLVHDVPYCADPERLRLRADAGPALGRLAAAGYALILVTNQPGVARGLFDAAALDLVWARLGMLLEPHGVRFAAIYYCPHHPQGSDPRYTGRCGCRKPAPGMLLRAAAEHGIDLKRSWMVGDILDDIEAGRRAGCRTVLLDVGSENEWMSGTLRQPHHVVTTLSAAADCITGRQATLRPAAVPPTTAS